MKRLYGVYKKDTNYKITFNLHLYRCNKALICDRY